MSAHVIKPLQTAGDTIVEVLIVLAVLSGALGYAYAIANTGLKQARDAQERSEALQLLQSQMEQLRSAAANAGASAPADNVFDQTSGFCFDSDGNLADLDHGWKPASVSAKQDYATGFGNYDTPGCTEGPAGYAYHYAITPLPNNIFRATARWQSNNNGLIDEVDLLYKVYPSE